MIDSTASLALWLAAGVYSPVVDDQALEPLFQPAPSGTFDGLRVNVSTAQWESGDPANLATDGELDARIYTDNRGVLQIDQLRLESGLAALRVRPLLGDGFDLALLGGSWDTTWAFIDAGSLQIQLYSPSLLTLLGFSNTDFDADRTLKHYFAVGMGPGARVTGSVIGNLGVFAHVDAIARTMNRHQANTLNQVRHEVSAEAGAGLGWTQDRTSVLLGGWGEVTTQWETRDKGGNDGVDRQYAAFGIQLTVLTQRDAPEPLEDEWDQLQKEGVIPL